MDVFYIYYLCSNFFHVTNGKLLTGMIPPKWTLVKRVTSIKSIFIYLNFPVLYETGHYTFKVSIINHHIL